MIKMMSKLLKLSFFALICVSLLSFVTLSSHVEASLPSVTARISSRFGDSNTGPNLQSNLDYGTRVEFVPPSPGSPYEFAFWSVNGFLRPDLPVDHQFLVNSRMELEAIFTPSTGSAIVYLDSNGYILHLDFTNGDVLDPIAETTITAPNRSGLTVLSGPERWEVLTGSGIGQTATQNTVLRLNYEESSVTTFTISGNSISLFNLTAGEALVSNEAPFNAVLRATAPDLPGEFSHWEEDGVVISFDEDYYFTALYDRTINAVFKSPADTPTAVVVLSPRLSLESGTFTYVGQMSLPDGATLIEYGFLVSNKPTATLVFDSAVQSIVGLDNGDIFNYISTGTPVFSIPSESKQVLTNEFVATFEINSHNAVRAFVTYWDVGVNPDNPGSNTPQVLLSENLRYSWTVVEDFSVITSGITSYTYSDTYVDSNSFEWEVFGRPGGATGFILGNVVDENFISVWAFEGFDVLKIDSVRFGTNTFARSFEVFINGVSVGTRSVDVNSNEIESFIFDDLGVEGIFNLRIESTSPGTRGSFDVTSVSWVPFGDPWSENGLDYFFERSISIPDEVEDDLTLPTSLSLFGKNYTLTWSSSDTDFISDNGTVTRPAMTEPNASVTLSLSIEDSNEIIVFTESYVVTVLAEELVISETFAGIANFAYTASGTIEGSSGIEWSYVDMLKGSDVNGDFVQLRPATSTTQMSSLVSDFTGGLTRLRIKAQAFSASRSFNIIITHSGTPSPVTLTVSGLGTTLSTFDFDNLSIFGDYTITITDFNHALKIYEIDLFPE